MFAGVLFSHSTMHDVCSILLHCLPKHPFFAIDSLCLKERQTSPAKQSNDFTAVFLRTPTRLKTIWHGDLCNKVYQGLWGNQRSPLLGLLFNESKFFICAAVETLLLFELPRSFFFFLTFSPKSCDARHHSEYPSSIKLTMKQLNFITFLFLIFTASGVSAQQILGLLPNPAPSDPTTNSSNPAPPKPSTPPESPVVVKVPGWTYRGCWSDNPLDRTLAVKKWRGYVTPEQCARRCKGYHFFGLEYSNE